MMRHSSRLNLLAVTTLILPRLLVSQTQTVYDVSANPDAKEFSVAAIFPTAGKETLFVSLPAWSPGNYEIQNYARYVHGFTAHNSAGASLRWDRRDKDTWRVVTGGSDHVTVDFDYVADTIDLSIARVRSDFGQFLGTNLFMFEEGHLERPADVRFHLPSGWHVTTALKGPVDGEYHAANYHELADAMTFLGRYSLDSLQAGGKWIRIALWPAADYTPAVARNLRYGIAKMAPVQNRIMGEAPYDVYTIFFNVIHGPVDFGGGLEHSSSQYDIMPAESFADPAGNLGDFIYPLLSHEFFHLWNVKRIRPAEMWPYDYHAEQYTPLLWWSEGVTDYYADLTNLRSGLWTAEQFLANAVKDMQEVESAPEPWSEEDGSAATWINEVFVNSSQLYYPKGALTGMLLDVSIRDATDNKSGLDDVTRALYARFYQKHKGFTTADLLALLREFGMPDVDGFYQRYVNGREPLPYEAVFSKAGVAVTRKTASVPFLGVNAQPNEQGKLVVQGVVPGSSAEAAGLQAGDELVKVGEVETRPDDDWASKFRQRYRGQAGAPLTITAQRGGQTVTLNTQVRERSTTVFSVTPASGASAKQAKLWRGL